MAISIRNNYVFKGHKALLGGKFVTYGEVELAVKNNLLDQSDSFDWGHTGPAAKQLAFSILHQVSDEEFAKENYVKFANDIVRTLHSRDWVLTGVEVISWISNKTEAVIEDNKPHLQNQKQSKKKKINVVKMVCNELGITQKNLAHILEVPEGTVSSWAVKNEIPRLGRKAIEFYIQSRRNQQIVDSYKSFVSLLNAS